MSPRFGLGLLCAAVLWCPAPASAISCANLGPFLDTAHDNDVITIDAGVTCNGPFGTTAKNITLQGAGAGATLSGNGTDRGWTSADSGAIVFKNLTFRSGHSTGTGGDIQLTGNVTPTLDHVTVLSGSAAGAGGGAYIQSSTAGGTIVVKDSSFGDGTPAGRNTASSGGGFSIGVDGTAKVEVSNTQVRGNAVTAAFGYGGGIEIGGNHDIALDGVTVSGNTANATGLAYAGGAYLNGAL